MSNGELKILSTENQYIKYKYTYGGNDYIIHTFLTRPKSRNQLHQQFILPRRLLLV